MNFNTFRFQSFKYNHIYSISTVRRDKIMWSGCFFKADLQRGCSQSVGICSWSRWQNRHSRKLRVVSSDCFSWMCRYHTLPLSVSTDLGAVLPPSGHQQQQEHLTLKLSFLITNKLRIQTKEIFLVLWLHPCHLHSLVCLSIYPEAFVSCCSVVSKAFLLM